jgi:hypothetical protein
MHMMCSTFKTVAFFCFNFAPSGQNSLFGNLTQKPTPPWKYIENFQFVRQIH